jgi:hypothetical protein
MVSTTSARYAGGNQPWVPRRCPRGVRADHEVGDDGDISRVGHVRDEAVRRGALPELGAQVGRGSMSGRRRLGHLRFYRLRLRGYLEADRVALGGRLHDPGQRQRPERLVSENDLTAPEARASPGRSRARERDAMAMGHREDRRHRLADGDDPVGMVEVAAVVVA